MYWPTSGCESHLTPPPRPPTEQPLTQSPTWCPAAVIPACPPPLPPAPPAPRPLAAHEYGVCHANNETAQLPPTRRILQPSENGAAPVTHARAASGRPSVGTSRFASLRASHRRLCSLRPACPSARPKGSSSGLRMAQCRRVSVSRCLYSPKILQVSE